MKIVLDANIIIAALIRDSHVRSLIVLSSFPLYYPENMLVEVHEFKELILKKSLMDQQTYEQLLAKLLNYITLTPTEKLIEHLPEAREIMKNIDLKDASFIAAALSYDDAVIWSDDAHFKQQTRVKTYNTEEITRIILRPNEGEDLNTS